jgi:hypothetical protein
VSSVQLPHVLVITAGGYGRRDIWYERHYLPRRGCGDGAVAATALLRRRRTYLPRSHSHGQDLEISQSGSPRTHDEMSFDASRPPTRARHAPLPPPVPPAPPRRRLSPSSATHLVPVSPSARLGSMPADLLRPRRHLSNLEPVLLHLYSHNAAACSAPALATRNPNDNVDLARPWPV